MYNKYIEANNLNIYGSKLVKIPTPKYIVFYNGKTEKQPVLNLRLSDAFIKHESTGDFEWTATMYNLNTGKNDNLLEQCRPLSEYMEFINRINRNIESYTIEEAVNIAVDSCIKDGVLAVFLKKHRAEVLDMCITEFNEKSFIEGIKEEGREEGIIEGEKRGELKMCVSLVNQGKLSIEDGAQQVNMSIEEFKKLLK